MMLQLVSARNCSNQSPTHIAIGVGRCVFRLDALSGSQISPLGYSSLTFTFEATGIYSGLPGTMLIWWQDVPIRRVQLNVFSKTQVELPLRSFKVPSTISIDIHFQFGENFYRGDFDQFSTSCGVLSEFRIAEKYDQLGGRAHLISAACRISEGVGLKGDYLDYTKVEILKEYINSSIIELRGMSIVRLGDGEGRILGYPNHFRDQEVLTQALYYHFGPDSMHSVKAKLPDTWIEHTVACLREKLVASIENADMVGLPVAEFYNEDASGDTFGRLGYACAMLYGLPFVRFDAAKGYIGTNVFQLAAAKGMLFKDIIGLPRSVYLVAPWDLTEALGEALKRSDLRYIRVPGHYTWRGSAGHGQYPELFQYVESRICQEGNLAGSLFFVGAGILGKHYCNLIKTRGGVALDIGSVFDSWAKKGLPYAVRNADISIEKLQG